MEHYYKNIQGWFDYSDLYSDVVKNFNSGSHFVEVGSWKGASAVYMGVEIINSGKEIKLDCIDNWEFSDEIYTSNADINLWKITAYNEFMENIKPLSNVVNYHKLNSIEGSKLYEDESLDFVFIDASHEYENIKNDLIHWYPKVKFNGVIAGHDYSSEVKPAVNEFFINKQFNILGSCWVHNKK